MLSPTKRTGLAPANCIISLVYIGRRLAGFAISEPHVECAYGHEQFCVFQNWGTHRQSLCEVGWVERVHHYDALQQCLEGARGGELLWEAHACDFGEPAAMQRAMQMVKEHMGWGKSPVQQRASLLGLLVRLVL